MSTLEEIKRFLTNKRTPVSEHQANSNWSIAAWVIAVILTLTGGTFFLITYPLHTVIVMLFMASIYFLDRG